MPQLREGMLEEGNRGRVEQRWHLLQQQNMGAVAAVGRVLWRWITTAKKKGRKDKGSAIVI